MTRSDSLYPEGLSLQSAHIFFRHGARTPTAPMFVHEHGLPMYWPLCTAARQMSTAICLPDSQDKDHTLKWRRVLETIGKNDTPEISERSGHLCDHGELTDIGRASMLALGQNLRRLYVDQLQLLPPILRSPNTIYFRSSPFPRALESLQHVIWGFFPPGTRDPGLGPPQIVMRNLRQETLLPNEDYCERFIQICKAYTKRTAERWNASLEMEYLNERLRGSMPAHRRVAVDSRPTMHAIHDYINATAATESLEIQLPRPFYDVRVRDVVDHIAFEEEYSAYHESQEMRRVGIGALMGDVVQRIVTHVEQQSPGTDDSVLSKSCPKVFLAGSHDSTLAAILVSLGALYGNSRRKWPSYGSVVSIELFRDSDMSNRREPLGMDATAIPLIGRTRSDDLSNEQKRRLQHYYVRVRYNQQSVVIPGCQGRGRNWRGNEDFCTLERFKEIVDRFTPRNWKQDCITNLDKPGLPERIEPAGY